MQYNIIYKLGIQDDSFIVELVLSKGINVFEYIFLHIYYLYIKRLSHRLYKNL